VFDDDENLPAASILTLLFSPTRAWARRLKQ